MLCEAFPAAQLKHWGLRHKGYSGAKAADIRLSMLASLNARVRISSAHAQIAGKNADAFDAIIAAYAASWDDAQTYVAWLQRVTGKSYRLLAEAEWEYAARAGATTAYPWGDDVRVNGTAMADCDGCGSQWDGKQPAPVGSFAPNAFGLYDMAGNAYHWVQDCYHLSYEVETPQDKVDAPTDGSEWTSGDCYLHVIRGGAYLSKPLYLRSAYRGKGGHDVRFKYIGFRVGRTLTP